MVSEVCAREYDATDVRSRGTRIEDGAMGRPSSRTAVGVAKEREEIIRCHVDGSFEETIRGGEI